MKRLRHLHITSILILGIAMNAASQQDFDRTVRPQSQRVPKVDLPDIQKATLKNGLKVWVVEAHELPLVSFNLVFQAGTDHDPVDKAGLAFLTADMLDEGTTTRSALQIADELDFIGANLGTAAGTDGTFITLNTLTKHLDKALDVYTDIMTNPTFPRGEFDRLKQQRLTALIQQRDRAATIASLAFNRILYGTQHPYGINSTGTEASLNTLTPEDLSTFYRSYYRPKNATLIIVGDVKLRPMVQKLEKLLGRWKPGPVNTLTPTTPSLVTKRTVYLIDKPGAPQSEIRIGFPAAARNTPDFFALTVMNRVLGGQFSSRLNMNLREKHGYTYGARSGFSFNKQPGPFTASAGVTASKTDSALIQFFYEIDRTFADGITAEELEFVKKGLTGNFALNFETPGQIAGALQNIVLYNLPENYYETYLQNINAVTLEDVQRVAKRYLDTSKMAVVVVGDLKLIREGVEKLKLGDIVLCDTDGKPL